MAKWDCIHKTKVCFCRGVGWWRKWKVQYFSNKPDNRNISQVICNHCFCSFNLEAIGRSMASRQMTLLPLTPMKGFAIFSMNKTFKTIVSTSSMIQQFSVHCNHNLSLNGSKGPFNLYANEEAVLPGSAGEPSKLRTK